MDAMIIIANATELWQRFGVEKKNSQSLLPFSCRSSEPSLVNLSPVFTAFFPSNNCYRRAFPQLEPVETSRPRRLNEQYRPPQLSPMYFCILHEIFFFVFQNKYMCV